MAALLLAGVLALSGCSGSDGSDGAPGQNGADGLPGDPGPAGPALGIKVTDMHGKAHALQATKGPNNPANLCTTITNASVGADGKLTIAFDVNSSGPDQVPCTADDLPFAGLPANVVNVVIAQLRPGDAAGDSSYWVNYINSSKTKAAGVGTTPDGTKRNQPGGETATAGTWTDMGNGSYRYVTSKVLTGGITIADLPKPGTYAYDPNLTHRVALQLGDHDGTGPATHGANNPIYDFIPATNQKVADPREIVVKENCNECHGTLSFHGSAGQRLDTKLCVMCHNATAGDPESGNVLDLKVMAHKIHMGRYLPSVAFDFAGESAGKYNLDPEGAVTGTPYVIWGHSDSKHEWSEVAFPANVANCTKCHKNATLADNWKTKPTIEACGACHDGINFADGTGTRLAFPGSKIDTTSSATGHLGGAEMSNADCHVCHQSSGTQTTSDSVPAPVPAMHDLAAKTKTDYIVDITMTPPANGTHYVSGEAPVVTVVLKDKVTGNPIDHTTLGTGYTANLYVYGPRASKEPVLTTAAASTTASTAGNSLLTTTTDPKVARTAASITYSLNSISGLQPGTYFVQVQATRPNPNPNTVSIGLKTFQVGTATEEKKVAVCTTCHENTMWHDSPNASVGNHPAPFDPDYCAACHDYKAASNGKLGLLIDNSNTKWKGGGVCVDTKGTSGTTDDTVDATLVTQNECVATANRKFMSSVCVAAGNIDPTITSSGACTAGTWTSYSANNLGFGAAPIARRVHGVHFAQKADGTPGVNYPFEIYNGHNVSIVFPQDVKNCETCHTAETTGTWATKPGRVPCLACHDSDAAQTHGALMTLDPTPYADATGSLPGPYSGDEQESCAVCHN